MATSYPPHVHHATQSITSDEALQFIQEYLFNVEIQPWLHPDAILSERGPQLAGTLSGGLTLHNLRRVEAGLRGERLGGATLQDPNLSYLKHHSAIEEPYNSHQDIRLENQEVIAREGYELGNKSGEPVVNNEEWQDMESYRRDQEITEGEIGRRDMGVADEGSGGVNTEVMVTTSATKKEEKSSEEKEERRKAKEERKRERADRRQAREKRRAERAAKK